MIETDALYPLVFTPVYKEVMWGGNKLETILNREIPPHSEPVGESWEIVDRDDAVSTVENGPLKGCTLRQLVEYYGKDLVGRSFNGGKFPLLVKLIDAGKRLSLQVHPDEAACSRTPGIEPKTEMWYIIHADKGAKIIAGLRNDTTKMRFLQNISTQEVESTLQIFDSVPGDAYFIKAGKVHAIGAGNLLLEIQQNSNTTFRISDWGRVDANGKSRELHLDAAREAWVTGKDETGYPTWREGVRFHQVSTDEVYGSLGTDGYFTETTPLNPHSPYSASKTSADLFVQAYSDTYKMPVSITRCSNNYGPYHFPEKLIPLIIKNILEGKKLPVYGDGSNVRDWLYVEDHCKAIDLVLHKGRTGEVYNVGGHNERTNLEIVKLTIRTIHHLMNENPAYREVLKKQETDPDGQISIDWINDSLITFVKDRLGHDQRYAIDPTKINNELGWIPETSFETGIVKTIRWYLEHQSWVDSIVGGDYIKYYEQMYSGRELN